MHKIRRIATLTFTALFSVTFVLVVALSQPLQATNNQYQSLIDLGIIDQVATPQDLGLDYLQNAPSETEVASLISSIREAEEELWVLDPNEPLLIPVETPPAIAREQVLQGQPDDLLAYSGFVAVQYVGGDGQVNDITAGDLGGMFATERSRACNGVLTVDCASIADLNETSETLYADTSGLFAQARRYPTFDLILYSPAGQRVAVQRINANAFCIRAIHATLRGDLRSARTGRYVL